MLPPEYLSSCSDQLIELYEELEDEIIADIARRIVKTGELSATAEWQTIQLQELGATQQEIIEKVAAMTDRTEAEIRRLFEEAALTNMENDARPLMEAGLDVDLRLSDAQRQILEATIRRTQGNLKNLTLTTGQTGGDLYLRASNEAYMKVTSGAFSLQEACWQSVEMASREGATVSFTRRRDKLDVAIRRNVVTSVNQTCANITESWSKEMGVEYYEVSAHPGARPEHAEWQGKVYKINGEEPGYPNFQDSTGYGTAAGLCGVNCRHSFYPFWPGISTPAYDESDRELFSMKVIEYQGESYTEYEAQQIKRSMERKIRQTKRVLVGADAGREAATDPEVRQKFKDAFDQNSALLRSQRKVLTDFCEATGRYVESDRIRVHGYTRSIAAKTGAANRRRRQS